jgi:phosphinothricin acetyltransferase
MLPADPMPDNRQPSRLPVVIRPAAQEDVPAITAIFNHAIVHTTASFYRDPRTIAQRTAWLTQRKPRYAVLVASTADGVCGWIALDPWSEKHGYRITAEVSYYVDPDCQNRGIGNQLVEHVITVARQNDFRNLLAKICENNHASLKIAERFGFQRVGTLKSIGEKFGRDYDVHLYQKQLLQ